MSLPALNIDLLNSLVNWAWADYTDHRDATAFGGTWNQGSWFETSDPQQGVCQSSYCIAGQAVAQVGFKMVLSECDWDYNAEPNEDGHAPAIRWRAHDCIQQVFDRLDDDGKPVFKEVGESRAIDTVAREALGINIHEASSLFNGSNSIERVLFIAHLICLARGLSLSLPSDAQEALDAEVSVKVNDGFFSVSDHIWYRGDGNSDAEDAIRDALFPKPPTCDTCGQLLPE